MTRPPHIEKRLQRDLNSILVQCETAPSISHAIDVMGTPVFFSFTTNPELQSLIEQAFFTANNRAPAANSGLTISVIDRQSLKVTPDFSWYSAQDAIVRGTPYTSPEWLLHSDSGSGVTTVIFPELRRIAILLRRIPELDPRAFITPFRISFEWIARELGGTILHAAVVARNETVVALAGPSGSGKSTLARALFQEGWFPVSDDATAYQNGYVFPIYRRLKWFIPDNPSTERLAQGKPFVTVSDTDPLFRQPRQLTALAFPSISGRFAMSLIARDEAVTALSVSSRSEFAGGFGGEESNYLDACSRVPTFRLSLGPDDRENARLLGDFLK